MDTAGRVHLRFSLGAGADYIGFSVLLLECPWREYSEFLYIWLCTEVPKGTAWEAARWKWCLKILPNINALANYYTENIIA